MSGDRKGAATRQVAPVVHVDSVVGKKVFLDFWKVPYSTDDRQGANVSIVLRDSITDEGEESLENALVLLRHEGEPALHRLDDGTWIFARVHPIGPFPEGLEVVTCVRDAKGRVVSAVLARSAKKVIYVPFFIDEVLEGFHYERYIVGRRTILPQTLAEAYYALKRLMPSRARAWARYLLARAQDTTRFPAWPLETSLEDFKLLVLRWLLEVSRTGSLPFIWFWPHGKEYCLILTHDVERSLEGNLGIANLGSVEKRLRFNSSLNIVPFLYPVTVGQIESLKSQGFEIGVHGFSHDAKLFRSWRDFVARVPAINERATEWGAAGFRSASTYRNPCWLNMLEFEYDSSSFDTDPFEPQPGGCLSLFPFFIGDTVEIPLTMPQDYTLFVLLRQQGIATWRDKADAIRRRNGVVCLVAHPDEGYIGDADKVRHYEEFLETLGNDARMWNPLPLELAQWWRRRNDSWIKVDGGAALTVNGGRDLSVRWARLSGGKLELDAAENA